MHMVPRFVLVALLLVLLGMPAQARRGMSGTLSYGTPPSDTGSNNRAGNDEMDDELDLTALDLAEDVGEGAAEQPSNSSADVAAILDTAPGVSEVGHDITGIFEDGRFAELTWSRTQKKMAESRNELQTSAELATLASMNTSTVDEDGPEFKAFMSVCKDSLIMSEVKVYRHYKDVKDICSFNSSSPAVKSVLNTLQEETDAGNIDSKGRNSRVMTKMQNHGFRAILKTGWTPDSYHFGSYVCKQIGNVIAKGRTLETAVKHYLPEYTVAAMKIMCCNKYGCITHKRCSSEDPIKGQCVAM